MIWDSFLRLNLKGLITLSIFLIYLPGPCLAQSRDTSAQVQDSISRSSVSSDSTSFTIGVATAQFFAGEIAFNATSFGLWGNDLYKFSSDNKIGVLGLLASTITVPLAIHFSSTLFGCHGSLGASIAGAAIGLIAVAPALLLTGTLPKTYLGVYLGFSLPIIIFGQLAYDLWIHGS